MALRSDITQVNDNRTIDLHEQRVTNPQADLANDVLDLRKPTVGQADNDNFFFEFMPATAFPIPTLSWDDIKAGALKRYRRTVTFAQSHPGAVIAGLATAIAILLFAWGATTHRAVTRTNPNPPAASAEVTQPSVTESASAAVSPAATTTARSGPASTTPPSPDAPSPSAPVANTAAQSGSADPTVCTPALAFLNPICASAAISH